MKKYPFQQIYEKQSEFLFNPPREIHVCDMETDGFDNVWVYRPTNGYSSAAVYQEKENGKFLDSARVPRDMYGHCSVRVGFSIEERFIPEKLKHKIDKR